MNNDLQEVVPEYVQSEEILQDDDDLQSLMPQMNVAIPPSAPIAEQREDLISNDSLLGVYSEILGMMRDEHKQVTGYIDNFADLVINDGDSSTSSKEALVGLVKIRSDIPDKMVKIADLMTRLKMKETNTFKPYLTAHQTNNVMIGDSGSERRELLNTIKKAQKKKKDK